jgi:peptidase S46-like protein
MRRLFSFVVAVTLLFSLAPSFAAADEGMWTFDNFPSAKVQRTYGVAPTAAFLDHVRKSALRIAGGCSASFVSPEGLVMTNHHCVLDCVAALSTQQQNYVDVGFYAQRREDEQKCPNFELNQLVSITDITKTIHDATAGKSGAAANAALRAATAKATQACGTAPSVRCDVVSLYHGGVYDLYRYKRYSDVRLAFAPEFSVAQFGGDPDNFNFPRFDFDIGMVRAYEDGKAAASSDYLRWSPNGSKAGEPVFVAGNPGGTSRERTNAQLTIERDYELPASMAYLAELRGVLEEFQKRGPEQRREANEVLFYIENSYKSATGRRLALVDPTFFGAKIAEERRLRAAVAANPALRSADASAWAEIEKIQPLRLDVALRDAAVRRAARGMLGTAVTLVRAAAERTKPNAQRLPEYTDQSLVRVEQSIASTEPIFADLEEVTFAFGLSKLRETLGADDPGAKAFLGNESPDQLAHRLVAGTKLADPAVRKALFDGGKDAIAASTDPMIVYARSIDPLLRAIRKEDEDRIEAPSRTAAERIAKARFAVYGTSIDPDATFTPRLSYGAVQGFPTLGGTQVPPYTTIGGLFERATGAAPYVLPQSWRDAKPSLDLTLPMNLSTTNDIIGGNSGSPLVNARGEVVGLIFDGNIFSLGGDYGYDLKRNRSVALDSRAMLAALSKVYHANRLVSELGAAGRR